MYIELSGLSLLVGFIIGGAFVVIYQEMWRWKASPKSCDHFWWIDENEELFCINCGAMKER